MPALVFELLSGTDQTDVTLLDQVQEWNATSHVFLGDADHQAGIGSDQVISSVCAIFN